MAACLLWSCAVAAAEPKTLRFGQMELAYDGERWRPEFAGDATISMQAAGAIARKLDTIAIARAPTEGLEGCKELGQRQFIGSLYDEPKTSPIEVAGVAGIRLSAHTRCRNATPKGVVVCLPYRGTGYVLKATQTGCRSPGYNLFSGIDPLQELLDGIRFVP